MTKIENARQQRNIVVTVAILAAVALAFYLFSFIQNWR